MNIERLLCSVGHARVLCHRSLDFSHTVNNFARRSLRHFTHVEAIFKRALMTSLFFATKIALDRT